MRWVVPCRYDPVVFTCVHAIQAHHPDDPIVVVDSTSPDPTYLNDLRDVGVDVIEGNTDYSVGAWALAYDRWPDTDRWALIQDSLIVHANLDHLTDPVVPVRVFPAVWGDRELTQHGRASLEALGIEEPAEWFGVFGPMMFCDRSVLAALDGIGFLDLPAESKQQASAMERVAGIALAHLGYDFAPCAIQGAGTHIFDQYPSDLVEKMHLDRQ